MRIENMRLYEDRDDVTLTAYILDESAELRMSKSRPAIIINPGGAYLMLSDREAEPIAMKFAGLGYQTFILRYSVQNDKINEWPKIGLELPLRKREKEYPAPLLELGKAMLIIKKHAAEWQVDAEQIGICGFSAGGHNCTLYASNWHRSILGDALNCSKNELRPAFCIVGYPFVDWELEYDLELDDDTKNAYRWMYFDYFGTGSPAREQMRQCSSNYNVSEKTTPTFIWTTSTDKAVDPRHSIRLALALAEHAVPFELHIFGEGHHGLALADCSTLQNEDDFNRTVAQWFTLVENWLEREVRITK